jgi:hypothetical protein
MKEKCIERWNTKDGYANENCHRLYTMCIISEKRNEGVRILCNLITDIHLGSPDKVATRTNIDLYGIKSRAGSTLYGRRHPRLSYMKRWVYLTCPQKFVLKLKDFKIHFV